MNYYGQENHDHLAEAYLPRFDLYQLDEFSPSASQQLDTVGMQPHSREYLERQINCHRSDRQFEKICDQYIDYPEGIQFSGKP